MVCGGSVMTAAYEFVEEEPNNPHAIDLKEIGLEEVLLLHSWTESHFEQWLRYEGNGCHEGCGFGLSEMLSEAPDIKGKWQEYAKSKGITVRGWPAKGPLRYEALRNDWIGQNYPWAEFDGSGRPSTIAANSTASGRKSSGSPWR